MATEFTGNGDPARSLALLWRTGERPTRGRKSGLTVDRIVQAAIELADEEGLGALAMRRVAERLGVGTMSLYTHVPGKAELLDVMLDTVLGEAAGVEGGELAAEAAGAADAGAGGAGDWRARLEAIARENRALYLRHPWLLQIATSRPPLGPNVTAKYDHELRAVEGIGLTDVEMDAVVTLLTGFVHGAVRGAVEAAEAERASGITDEQWWEAHAPLLDRIIDFERWPVAGRVGQAAGEAHGGAYGPEHAFEFGLARVLDGIAVLVRARQGEPESDPNAASENG
ncbi:TetR/AcrR family transcriptional regulator [Conexibacter woesei]|uniref:Transcriptional regulator, TetR family n=1 Tax=Conexibacter woesei (strain DSM 14684 / CCUG 47730 / CIP 108061 / JCM 11494 / NBRC 100937 / ID131577) TaxID=469383 RepID=D3F1M5_CONWI|nr:TetR/AcrR family transcriptional regulator [Conexibacter woesei]ADB54056.1 transcriptional regulator, TetR family [Conexibacter woesei DSM 14684]